MLSHNQKREPFHGEDSHREGPWPPASRATSGPGSPARGNRSQVEGGGAGRGGAWVPSAAARGQPGSAPGGRAEPPGKSASSGAAPLSGPGPPGLGGAFGSAPGPEGARRAAWSGGRALWAPCARGGGESRAGGARTGPAAALSSPPRSPRRRAPLAASLPSPPHSPRRRPRPEPGAGPERPGAAPGRGPRNGSRSASGLQPARGPPGSPSCAPSRGAAGAAAEGRGVGGEGGRRRQAALGRAFPAGESTSAVFTERPPGRARAAGAASVSPRPTAPAWGQRATAPVPPGLALGEGPALLMIGVERGGGPGPWPVGLSPVVRWSGVDSDGCQECVRWGGRYFSRPRQESPGSSLPAWIPLPESRPGLVFQASETLSQQSGPPLFFPGRRFGGSAEIHPGRLPAFRMKALDSQWCP